MDVEGAVVAGLASDVLLSAHVAGRVHRWDEALGLLPAVTVTGGPGVPITEPAVWLDAVTVQLDVFAPTAAQAREVADETRAAAHRLAGSTVEGVVISDVATTATPFHVRESNRQYARVTTDVVVTAHPEET